MTTRDIFVKEKLSPNCSDNLSVKLKSRVLWNTIHIIHTIHMHCVCVYDIFYHLFTTKEKRKMFLDENEPR